jgi:uncharacterized protein YkwD
MSRLRCVCFWLSASLVLAACAARARAQAEADAAAAQVAQLVKKFPGVRGFEARAALVKDLVALGPPGVAAARDLIDKDIERLAAKPGVPPKETRYDPQISELRKLLADLRADPNLSHDRLEKVGLPALDELSQLYRLASRRIAARDVKLAKLAAQLRQEAKLVEILQGKDKQPSPLPLAEFAQRIGKLQADLYTAEEKQALKVFADNAALARNFDANVLAGMDAVNNIRMTCGLCPLTYDVKLSTAAHGHSMDMMANNFFSHESPVPGKKTFSDRAKLAGTTAAGENIFMGSAVSAAAIRGWFLSPGHHKNLLAPDHRRQGLGQAGKYWTQMFGA